MRYSEFSIRLDPGEGGRFLARIVRSPAGQASGDVVLDLDENALPRMATRFERLARQGGGLLEVADEAALHDLGGRLGAALFSPPLAERFSAALEKVRKEGGGLRLRLQMELNSPEAARLFALPWEALRPPGARLAVSLCRPTALVRSVDLPLGCEPLQLRGPLRILVVPAAPRDQPTLDLDGEVRALRAAFFRRKASVDVARGDDLLDLRERLLEGRYHVLHFLGHAGVDEATGEGVLYFEGEGGLTRPVKGKDLAALVAVGLPALRLVFLNACRTARAANASPFAAVGAALLHAGLPAVLAMQFPLSDRAALAFSRTVYRRLAQGDPLEAAVVEGRHAIQAASPDSGEWVTPVLFLRAEDGQIVVRSPWRRFVLGLIAALLFLAGALGWNVYRFLADTATAPNSPPAQIQGQERLEKKPREAAPAPSAPAPPPPTQARALPLVSLAPAKKTVSTPITLADGEAADVEAWRSRIAVQFQEPGEFPALGDHEVVTITLTNERGDSMQLAALGAPYPLEFRLGGRTRRVRVEHIDRQAKTVRLLPLGR